MRYQVMVTRTSWMTQQFDVDAADEDEARDIALEEASNTAFSLRDEVDFTYDVDTCEALNPEEDTSFEP